MNTHSILAVSALALAAMSAQAEPIVLDLSSGSASFSSGAASQEYQFTLDSDSLGDGSITATFGANSGYVISDIVFEGVTLTPEFSGPKFANYTLFDGPLTAGTYSFIVNGLSKGGDYTGRIDVSAVPEPETLGMLLAGLAAVGMVTARRRRNS